MDNQAEYDKHVAFVAGELRRFYYDRRSDTDTDKVALKRYEESLKRAHDIVQWVTSKPVDRWNNWRVWSFGYWIGALATLLMVWLVSNI
jgi:hypothetical protein